MKKILSLFAALVVAFSSFADPAIVTKKFKVANFNSIELGSAFEVHVHKGNVYSVSVTGKESDIDELEVSSSAGKLEISYDYGRKWKWSWNNNHSKMVINITLPRLNSGDFSGASKVDLQGFSNEEEMSLVFSGASKGLIEGLHADKLKIELSGASDCKITGHTDYLKVEASGASHLKALDFFARNVDVDASGASSAQVHVQKSLKVDASGASHVKYKGSPVISKDLSGAASLHQVN